MASAAVNLVRGTRSLCSKLVLQTQHVNRIINHGKGARPFHASAFVCHPAHDANFESAKARLNALTEDPGNEAKLKIYGLFKQATQGKCNAPKPGMMDLVGKAKWGAWNSLGDMSQDDAQLAYIALVDSLAGEEEAEQAAQKANQGEGVQYEGMTIHREGKAFIIQLNRPKKKNAITWQMYRDIGKSLREAAESKTHSIAVITGTGDFFCSGNDLSNFTNVTPEQIPAMAKNGREVLEEFVSSYIDFPKPLVALINGPAVGISVTMLGLCDAVYCTDAATFHTPFSNLGQSPEACSSYTFPKIMGYAKANEMLLFNKKISAAEAKDRGLVSEVIPDASFQAESRKIIEQYASFPPQSLRLSKVLNRSTELATLKDVNARECELLEERWQSQECIKAIMAFFSRK